MQKIFKDKKEPLYGRNTAELKLKPFQPSVMKQIMADAKPGYSSEDLLAMFTFTGGVAKYVNQLVDAGALDKDAMIRHIISPNSTFLNEGKNNLIEEFGKDYNTFSGLMLERWFHRVAMEGGEFTRIGRWWDRNRRTSSRVTRWLMRV